MLSLLARLPVLVMLLTPAATSVSVQESRNAAPRPEVRGVVVESGTETGVSEAEVTLEFYGATRLAQSPPKSTLTTKTDASGSFVFRPEDLGQFEIRAKKDGYSELPPYPGVTSASRQNVTLGAATPARDVRLFLCRPAQLTGLVLSEEAGQPVANVRLRAMRVMSRGTFLPIAAPDGTSDAQGKFSVGNLAPGDYVVVILPRKLTEERVLSSFSEEDVKAVDQDFEHSYWPGGRGMDAASPVSLVSGATVDIGVLEARTTEYHRVHVRFPGWNCEDGDVTKVFENRQIGRVSSMAGLADAPCGRDLLVTGFPSGAYRLMFGLKKPDGETAGGAVLPFAIGGENLKLTAPLERPLTVNGAVVAAEGAKLPDLPSVVLRLSPASRMAIMLPSPPVKADAEGKFRLQALSVEAHRLAVSGVGPGHYVKEVRYNGIPVADDLVSINSGAVTQELTIVLDDKPAVITGTVVKNGKPVSRPVLVLARWPLPSGETSPRNTTAAGDEKGRFSIGGLAPGEYRLIALTREALLATDPDTIQRALAASQRIELGPRAVQNVTLELAELR